KTTVLDIPAIFEGWTSTCRALYRGHDQPVLGGLYVPIRSKGQTGIEEPGIQTHIELLGGLPFNIGIGDPCRYRSGPGNGFGVAKIITRVAIGYIGAIDKI